jgi:hypothetical protein
VNRQARLAGLAALILAVAAAPTAAFSAPTLVRPSPSAIASVLAHTTEVGSPRVHFKRYVGPLTIPDGHGGSLTAVIGGRWPTADGYGQLIFFWHNAAFLGWDARYESIAIGPMKAGGTGVIQAQFAHYRPSDPLCCPKLPPLKISFRWNGNFLVASRNPPYGPGRPVFVRLQR